MLDIILCVADTIMNTEDKTHGIYILLGETIYSRQEMLWRKVIRQNLEASGNTEY